MLYFYSNAYLPYITVQLTPAQYVILIKWKHTPILKPPLVGTDHYISGTPHRRPSHQKTCLLLTQLQVMIVHLLDNLAYCNVLAESY